MAQVDAQLSTGLVGLDRVLKGLIPGDNIVWQVNAVEDYAPFVTPYCAFARERGHKLIYFRFARHQPLVARLIGRVAHANAKEGTGITMLVGPGRWGTTTPSLGVPVSFAEINTVSVLCEVVAMREDLVPDVSLGTHFFNELVEMDVLYMALFPGREGNSINSEFLQQAPNRLTELLPEADRWAEVVKVLYASDLGDGATLRLNANALDQKVVCYVYRQVDKQRSGKP
jgi:hypothetical protein